jgi:hypothetical protein
MKSLPSNYTKSTKAQRKMQGLLQGVVRRVKIADRQGRKTHKNRGYEPGKNCGNVRFALDGIG